VGGDHGGDPCGLLGKTLIDVRFSGLLRLAVQQEQEITKPLKLTKN